MLLLVFNTQSFAKVCRVLSEVGGFFFSAIKMKLTISILTLAIASNFISLVICADFSKKDSNLVKKSVNLTNETITTSNSTLDLRNSTLSAKNDDKNSTSSRNSTTVPSLITDRKISSNKTDDKVKAPPQGNKPIKLNESANKIANNKTNTTLLGRNNNDKNATIPLKNGKNDAPKIGDKTTTTSRPSVDKMIPTTERVKPNTVTPPKIGRPANSTIEKIKKEQPNLKTTTERVKSTTELPKIRRPVSPTNLGNKNPTSASPKPTPTRPIAVGPKQEAPQNPMFKLPIGLIDEKMKSTTESVRPKNISTEIPSASTDAAVDNAWKIVKEKKYDDLNKKHLPKYEIPAKDLQELEDETPKNGTNSVDLSQRAANVSTINTPALLKEVIAKEMKEAMEKHEQAESEHEMSTWKIVALILLPLFLITIGIMLFIGIRQRMNAAKGRSVVYELTSELGKKNDEKPVIST